MSDSPACTEQIGVLTCTDFYPDYFPMWCDPCLVNNGMEPLDWSRLDNGGFWW